MPVTSEAYVNQQIRALTTYGEILNADLASQESVEVNMFSHPEQLQYFREVFTSFLNSGRHCPDRCRYIKNLQQNTNFRLTINVAEYVDTAARVMAGFMLAATGAFMFFPEAAKDFFPWMAE